MKKSFTLTIILILTVICLSASLLVLNNKKANAKPKVVNKDVIVEQEEKTTSTDNKKEAEKNSVLITNDFLASDMKNKVYLSDDRYNVDQLVTNYIHYRMNGDNVDKLKQMVSEKGLEELKKNPNIYFSKDNKINNIKMFKTGLNENEVNVEAIFLMNHITEKYKDRIVIHMSIRVKNYNGNWLVDKDKIDYLEARIGK